MQWRLGMTAGHQGVEGKRVSVGMDGGRALKMAGICVRAQQQPPEEAGRRRAAGREHSGAIEEASAADILTRSKRGPKLVTIFVHDEAWSRWRRNRGQWWTGTF